MSIPDYVDVEAMIARFAGPLAPVDREVFRRATEDALGLRGEGAAHRALVRCGPTIFIRPPSATCATRTAPAVAFMSRPSAPSQAHQFISRLPRIFDHEPSTAS
jgi:hypothetical protein